MLVYFKYVNFFAESFVVLANSMGVHLSLVTLRVFLPLGISFYVFQSLTYPLDIYAGKLKPTSSFIDFAAFVSFFAKLIAGPITRARDFLPQLERKRWFEVEDLQEGCLRILTGYFRKAFIADTLAIHLVNPILANPGSYSAGLLWLGMFGYAVQIYADFSGYSNIAIGSARILGFRIPENFMFPYAATNFSEFWRRWHITMSAFFRDYVYIPLGGSRAGPVRAALNLEITMLLCGLWHGAAWTFVSWGTLHGLYLIMNNFLRKRGKESQGKEESSHSTFRIVNMWLFTQILVCIAWVFFFAPDFRTCMIYFKGLLRFGGHDSLTFSPLVWCSFIAFLVDHAYGWVSIKRPDWIHRVPMTMHAVVYALMIVILYHVVPEKTNPFIYFQF
jgi:alginate O-acetyltransferase complex protein AlgI